MRTILFAIFLLALVACTKGTKNPEAMRSKSLYQRVTKCYDAPEDSLKRRAVDFLFRNIEIHYEQQSALSFNEGLTGEDTVITNYKNVFLKLDTLYHYQSQLSPSEILSVADEAMRQYGRVQTIGNKLIPDTAVLSAEYLVNNIDLAFTSWRRASWAKQMDFGTFCEYVLPYRVLHEQVEFWRPRLYYQCQLSVSSPNVLEVYKQTLNSLDASFMIENNIYKYYPFKQSIGDLTNGRVGVCLDGCLYKISVLRSQGIPVALDYIPHWGNIASWHYMPKLIHPDVPRKIMTNENLPISTGDIIDVSSAIEGQMSPIPEEDLPSNIDVQYVKTVPKVYRFTYSKQADVDSVSPFVSIEIFSELFALNKKDVTDEYISCALSV